MTLANLFGLRKYLSITKISLRNIMAYKSDVFANALFVSLIIFILIHLWKAVFAGSTGLIEGYTLTMMVWYLALTESIVTAPGKVIEDLGEEIQSGNIAQTLNKPYSYPLFLYFNNLTRSLFRFSVTFAIGSLITFLIIGPVEITLLTIPVVLISAFLAITLHFCMMLFLGIFSFWLEDSRSLAFLYSKVIFIFGGMLLPLEIFPNWLETIATKLPFSYVAYHPAKLFVQTSPKLAIRTISVQLLWIFVVIVCAALLYKFLSKKLTINGG